MPSFESTSGDLALRPRRRKTEDVKHRQHRQRLGAADVAAAVAEPIGLADGEGRHRHPAAKFRNPDRPAAVVFNPGPDRPAVLAVAAAALAGGRLPFLILMMLLGVSAAERAVFAVLRKCPMTRAWHHSCCDKHHEHKPDARADNGEHCHHRHGT